MWIAGISSFPKHFSTFSFQSRFFQSSFSLLFYSLHHSLSQKWSPFGSTPPTSLDISESSLVLLAFISTSLIPCMSYSFHVLPLNPLYSLFIFFYFLSYIADALDGYAARSLNQCISCFFVFQQSIGSKFGACLDMTTDRYSTPQIHGHRSPLVDSAVLVFSLFLLTTILMRPTTTFSSWPSTSSLTGPRCTRMDLFFFHDIS